MNTVTNTNPTLNSNDYHRVPVTEKQLSYAKKIAAISRKILPEHVLDDRYALSRWIDRNKSAKPTGPFANYPSSKQVHYAESIARAKRRVVPHECFRDRVKMSRWIEMNR